MKSLRLMHTTSKWLQKRCSNKIGKFQIKFSDFFAFCWYNIFIDKGDDFMPQLRIVNETTPVNVSHDTYRRECRYTRGIHIPHEDFVDILDNMCHDTRLYFDFHNPGKKLNLVHI